MLWGLSNLNFKFLNCFTTSTDQWGQQSLQRFLGLGITLCTLTNFCSGQNTTYSGILVYFTKFNFMNKSKTDDE